MKPQRKRSVNQSWEENFYLLKVHKEAHSNCNALKRYKDDKTL